MKDIEKKLSYNFKDPSLLKLAFTHRSYCNEHLELELVHNERLEFLGDSVLGLIVADHLYSSYPEKDEGELSTLRSQLVDASACASYLKQLDIEAYLQLGKGESLNQGKGRQSLLSDLFEALIGAIYLDSGLMSAKRFFFHHFSSVVDQTVIEPQHNWKAELQDYAQKNYQETPIYKLLEESGLDHERLFRMGVFIGEKMVGEGSGFSKKEAQIEAAKNALET